METITVRFSEGVPSDAQAVSLMLLEKQLRTITGMDCRVFKEKMGDDSKLRIKMTQMERDKL